MGAETGMRDGQKGAAIASFPSKRGTLDLGQSWTPPRLAWQHASGGGPLSLLCTEYCTVLSNSSRSSLHSRPIPIAPPAVDRSYLAACCPLPTRRPLPTAHQPAGPRGRTGGAAAVRWRAVGRLRSRPSRYPASARRSGALAWHPHIVNPPPTAAEPFLPRRRTLVALPVSSAARCRSPPRPKTRRLAPHQPAASRPFRNHSACHALASRVLAARVAGQTLMRSPPGARHHRFEISMHSG
ncbi:hypothetical protein EJ04DRAFT_603904 [Polyplosphaeria fusca]|uniref:Uncharacterized protein n=1 Tax=Polyplosphaeria fusca TaxID=682080 RepID=A0A9P4UZ97_9PLEO|nr:hypothetical protein EJ04DRAFT_603904 [Polyplosphaeria fusca]